MTPLRRDAATFPPAYDYLSELCEEEKGLGFEEELIPALDDAAASRTLPAVVFRIDESNRIVKIRDELLDRPVYLHQCYGTCRRFKTPAWRPVQYSFSTPQLAIRSWERGLDNGDGGRLLLRRLTCLASRTSKLPFCSIAADGSGTDAAARASRRSEDAFPELAPFPPALSPCPC